MLLLSCQCIKMFNLAELLLGRSLCPEVGFLIAFSMHNIHQCYANKLNPENVYKQKGKGCAFPIGK